MEEEVDIAEPWTSRALLGGSGDSVSRAIMRMIRVAIWVLGVINLLTTSPSKYRPCHANLSIPEDNPSQGVQQMARMSDLGLLLTLIQAHQIILACQHKLLALVCKGNMT